MYKLDFVTTSELQNKLCTLKSCLAAETKNWHETHNYIFLEAAAQTQKEVNEILRALNH